MSTELSTEVLSSPGSQRIERDATRDAHSTSAYLTQLAVMFQQNTTSWTTINEERIESLIVTSNESSMQPMFSAVIAASQRLGELATQLHASMGALVTFTTSTAESLVKETQQASQIGTQVDELREFDYRVKQMGAEAPQARQSLENFSHALQQRPETEHLLTGMGVQTRDEEGNQRDMVRLFTDFSRQLTSLPETQMNHILQQFGVTQDTVTAVSHAPDTLSSPSGQLLSNSNFDAQQATGEAEHFLRSLSHFDDLLSGVKTKWGSDLAEPMSRLLDTLSKQIMDNFPTIDRLFNQGVAVLVDLAEGVIHVVKRLFQGAEDLQNWWHSLDDDSQAFIMVCGGIIGAWMLLNSAFLTSPLGIITALGGAIYALYDSYKTWQEGGKTLIDWDSWMPGLNYAGKALQGLASDFVGLYDKLVPLGASLSVAFKSLMQLLGIDISAFKGKDLFDLLMGSVRGTITLIGNLIDLLRQVIEGDFSGAWETLKTAVRNGVENSPAALLAQKMVPLNTGASGGVIPPAAMENLQNPETRRLMSNRINAPATTDVAYHYPLSSAPAIPGASNSPVFNQETNIYVQGVSDPQQVSEKVAQHQTDINERVLEQHRVRSN